MCAKDEVEALMKELGAELVRQNKHRIYRLPNGRTFPLPSTPSDWRSWKNQKAQLRALAGLPREVKPPRQRRAKKNAHEAPVGETTLRRTDRPLGDFAHKLAHALGEEAFPALMQSKGVRKIG